MTCLRRRSVAYCTIMKLPLSCGLLKIAVGIRHFSSYSYGEVLQQSSANVACRILRLSEQSVTYITSSLLLSLLQACLTTISADLISQLLNAVQLETVATASQTSSDDNTRSLSFPMESTGRRSNDRRSCSYFSPRSLRLDIEWRSICILVRRRDEFRGRAGGH